MSKGVNEPQKANQCMKSIRSTYQKNQQTLVQPLAQGPHQATPMPKPTPVTPQNSFSATSKTPLPPSIQLPSFND